MNKVSIISMWNDGLPFLQVSTNFISVKSTRKLNQNSFLIERQQYGSCDTRSDKACSCIVLQNQTFKISCFTYLATAFKTSKFKTSRFKNFCWLHGFTVHYESVESVEIWENFLLLPWVIIGLTITINIPLPDVPILRVETNFVV